MQDSNYGASPETIDKALELLEKRREIRLEQRRLLSLDDVASVLNVSRRTVEKMIADGDLTAIRIRGVRRFDPADIDAYIDGKKG